jgi:iron(III) transport system ATP-binding protein
MAELRIVGLEKHYGPTRALQGIDLVVTQGELVGVLGPSGCGKTTLLQVLAGFLVPDAGEIWLNDELISSARGVVPPERRRMSLVFQSYALWPHMTCFQNVAFGLEMRRLPRQQVAERVARILAVVNLAGYDGRYPAELSGGQQQRVALARALVVEPETLLLDEPLSNLDASLREQMRFEIRRIHDETGITMVYVTHDQAEAMVIADRIAVVNAGRIEQIGTPPEIYEAPRSRFVASFIGQTNCLPGRVVAPGVVQCGELKLEAAQGEPIPVGEEAVLCVRPHAVRVLPGDATIGPSNNCSRAAVVQEVYLGDRRDLRVQLANGLQLRALAATGQRHAAGSEVVVHLPPEACRLVRP